MNAKEHKLELLRIESPTRCYHFASSIFSPSSPTLSSFFSIILFVSFFIFQVVSIVDAQQTSLPTTTFGRGYVTILPSEDEVLGVRTLGVSLNHTGASLEGASRVVLTTESISARAVNILRNEGWQVYRVRIPTSVFDIQAAGEVALSSSVEPTTSYSYWNALHPTFIELYLKISAFSLHSHGFKKVIYLDSDMVIHDNIDPLFRCGEGFCAVETSGMFPTHLMVLQPSFEVHRMLLGELVKEASRTFSSALPVREFEFLNALLPINNQELVTCPLFDLDAPSLWPPDPFTGTPLTEDQKSSFPKCSRLAVHMFGDMGRYYLHMTNWLFPNNRSYPSVTHLERGGMKPWHFYTHLLIDLNWEWLNLSEELQPRDLPPNGLWEALLTDWLVTFSLFLTGSLWFWCYLFVGSELEQRTWTRVCYFIRWFISWAHLEEDSTRSPSSTPKNTNNSSNISAVRQVLISLLTRKPAFVYFSLLVGYISVLSALGLCMTLLPLTIHGNPWRSWAAFISLGWTFFYVFFGSYCRLCFFYGQLKVAVGGAKEKRYLEDSGYQSRSLEPALYPKRPTLTWFLGMPLFMIIMLLWLYNDSRIIHKPMFKFWALVSSGVSLLIGASVSFARLAVLWRRYGIYYSSSASHVL